jgi:branched-chain amino acid aminotransferase
MFKLETSTAYLRDSFVSFQQANVSIASSPVLYGLTFYTVFSVNWNTKQQKLYIFRLREHYQRLVNSAKIMDFHQFATEWPYERFETIMFELLERNTVKEDALVRVAVFIDELIAGTRIHGLQNSLSAYVYPMGQILNRDGVHACVSSWVRTPDNAMPSRAKLNGSYINASLMKNEALLNGYDEAIALDQDGHVTEGTVANLFLVRGGELVTPHAATDLLEGITRSSVISMAQDSGMVTHQRSVDRSELYIADEAFFCGSSARITPILSIDKRMVGDGKAGPITTQLMETYDRLQHAETSDKHNWLTTPTAS